MHIEAITMPLDGSKPQFLVRMILDELLIKMGGSKDWKDAEFGSGSVALIDALDKAQRLMPDFTYSGLKA